MHSTFKLFVVFCYCLAILYGFGYVIFFRDASPWWWILTGFLLPGPESISKWTSNRSED